MTGDLPGLRFHLPHPALRQHVSAYYALDVGRDAIDDRLHPEWGNVRFALAGDWTCSLEDRTDAGALAPRATLFGPTSRSMRITGTPGARLFGFGLLPLGWAQLLQAPADRFADRMLPLTELAGARAARWLGWLQRDADDAARVARVDRFLLRRLAGAPAADPHLAALHGVLVSGEIGTVAGFAAQVGVTERTLERLCPRLFGFAPKQLLRRQRFLRTLDRVVHNPTRPLTELLDAHYADQPHFVREFRAIMGLTPTAYFAEPRTMMRLAAAERERVVGQTMQGLHRAPAPSGDGGAA